MCHSSGNKEDGWKLLCFHVRFDKLCISCSWSCQASKHLTEITSLLEVFEKQIDHYFCKLFQREVMFQLSVELFTCPRLAFLALPGSHRPGQDSPSPWPGFTSAHFLCFRCCALPRGSHHCYHRLSVVFHKLRIQNKNFPSKHFKSSRTSYPLLLPLLPHLLATHNPENNVQHHPNLSWKLNPNLEWPLLSPFLSSILQVTDPSLKESVPIY